MAFILPVLLIGVIHRPGISDNPLFVAIWMMACCFLVYLNVKLIQLDSWIRNRKPIHEAADRHDVPAAIQSKQNFWRKIIAGVKTWPLWATILVAIAILCFGIPAFLFFVYYFIGALVFIFGDLFEAITGYHGFV